MKKQISNEALNRAKRSIKQIAKSHGVSEAKVRADMLEAMRAGMESPDPEAQKLWREIPWRGPEPTVEEFIAWTVLQIENGPVDEQN